MISFILYSVCGLFAGLVSGLLGIGGGMVVVPALAYVFASQGIVPAANIMHMAIGSSLAIMILTSQASVFAHNAYGRILWSIYKKLVPGIIVGSIIGVVLADMMHSNLLNILFGIFLITIAFSIFFFLQPSAKAGLPGPITLNSAAFGIGTLSAMLGIGGGSLTTPFLLRCNVPMRNTIAISALGSLTVAIVGSIVNIITGWNEPNLPAWSSGYIFWPAVVMVSITSMITAPLGARLAYRLPAVTLRRFFSLLLLLTGLSMLY